MTFQCLISIQCNRFHYCLLICTLIWLRTPPHTLLSSCPELLRTQHTHTPFLLPQALISLQPSSPLCTRHVMSCHLLFMNYPMPPYLKQEFTGVLCAVEQFYCSYIIASPFFFVVPVEICRVAQDRKQGVNPNPSSNQDEVSRGICGLRVKEELSTYSESHF